MYPENQCKLIAAVDLNDAIAYKQEFSFKYDIPWKLKDDLKWFKEKTMHNIVVFGYKTWIGLPDLPGRFPYVITKKHKGHVLHNRIFDVNADDWNSFIAEMKVYRGYKDIYIAGGAQIYELALDNDIVNEVFLTKVKRRYKGKKILFPQEHLDKIYRWKHETIKSGDEFDIVRYYK